MWFFRFIVISILMFLTGCATPPVNYIKIAYPDVLESGNGPVLLIDSCIRRKTTSGDEHVLIEESIASAQTLEKVVTSYLLAHGLSPHSSGGPYVCIASQGSAKTLRVADNVDDSPRDQQPPYGADEDFVGDVEYLSALGDISRFASQSPYLDDEKGASSLGTSIGKEQLADALDLFMSRTGASSVIYLGINGLGLSGGAKIAHGVASVVVDTITSVATMGIVRTGTTQYGVSIHPKSTPNSLVISAALIDLQSRDVLWFDALKIIGDPTQSEVVGRAAPVDFLLDDLVRDPATSWSPPGAVTLQGVQ